MNMREITLSTGVIIRARPVPPLLASELTAGNPDLRAPDMPYVDVPGVAGTEIVPARPGQPEYETWARERDRIDDARRRIHQDFIWGYGVISWRLPGESKFVDTPPDDWEIPEMCSYLGFVPREGSAGRRLDYIKTEIITTQPDVESVMKVTIGFTDEITDEEVDSVVNTFPGDEE